jgi:hypothetical protein
MTTYSETFKFVYSVSVENGHFVIEDSKPLAKGVTVSDDDPLLRRHDKFKVDDNLSGSHHHGHEHETLTFVSRAKDAAGDQGFIAKDGDGNYFFFTQDHITGHHEHQLIEEHGAEHICFMPGTRIRTPSGEVPVERLAVDDLVLTPTGEAIRVRWIGRQTVSRRFLDELRLPVCVKAGALADAVPSRDLHLSPDHALFIDGVLIQAGSLVNGTSIVRSHDGPPVFTYYHVEVDDHALILAENTPAETFIDNVGRMSFDNWREHEALYPEGKAMTELPHPRAKAHRQVPGAMRVRLAERGAASRGRRDAAA